MSWLQVLTLVGQVAIICALISVGRSLRRIWRATPTRDELRQLVHAELEAERLAKPALGRAYRRWLGALASGEKDLPPPEDPRWQDPPAAGAANA